MKAVVYDRYGSPDVLRVEDVPVPSPAKGQVRVKVAATSINLSDWESLTGSPAYARIGGLRSPSRRTLGSDIAGVVDEVGEGVTRFRAGRRGVRRQPLADGWLRGVRDRAGVGTRAQAGRAHVRRGVDAPAGGRDRPAGHGKSRGGEPGADQRRRRRVGSLRHPARQAARRSRDGVDNADKQDFMRAVGADEVIDYSRDDFTRATAPYDQILDLVAYRSVFAYRRALAPGGTYRCVGGTVRALLRVLTVGSVIGRATGRSHRGAGGEGGPSPLRAPCRPLRRRGCPDPHRPHLHARRGACRACSCRCGTRSRQGCRRSRLARPPRTTAGEESPCGWGTRTPPRASCG